MEDNSPLVSIGMPVYNGERFIPQALDSLLAQDYEKFELIISDNASTDRTGEICREYAARDERISYHRNAENMGGVWNFRRVLELSSGEYFMWAADHDIWDQTFISQCTKILIDDPLAELCYSQTRFMDLEGNALEMATDLLDTQSVSDPSKRFHSVIWIARRCDSFYGLMRLSTIKEIQFLESVLQSDHFILGALSLKGTFVQIPATLFYLRKIRPGESGKQAIQRRFQTLGPNVNRNFPRILLMLHHLALVMNAHISLRGKAILTIQVIYCFIKRFSVLAELRYVILSYWRAILRMVIRLVKTRDKTT